MKWYGLYPFYYSSWHKCTCTCFLGEKWLSDCIHSFKREEFCIWRILSLTGSDWSCQINLPICSGLLLPCSWFCRPYCNIPVFQVDFTVCWYISDWLHRVMIYFRLTSRCDDIFQIDFTVCWCTCVFQIDFTMCSGLLFALVMVLFFFGWSCLIVYLTIGYNYVSAILHLL